MPFRSDLISAPVRAIPAAHVSRILYSLRARLFRAIGVWASWESGGMSAEGLARHGRPTRQPAPRPTPFRSRKLGRGLALSNRRALTSPRFTGSLLLHAEVVELVDALRSGRS